MSYMQTSVMGCDVFLNSSRFTSFSNRFLLNFSRIGYPIVVGNNLETCWYASGSTPFWERIIWTHISLILSPTWKILQGVIQTSPFTRVVYWSIGYLFDISDSLLPNSRRRYLDSYQLGTVHCQASWSFRFRANQLLLRSSNSMSTRRWRFDWNMTFE